ncbi:hypothetical protein Drose_06120 [Dactylosporangium roseum]|uniref:Minor tail protein n=1 Tax=Dactylosporangium roseum TaxID=47989 RepID=A0ABY5ZAX5_9ACTN|nr:hypothetical protein [Dactylosporangium roseum]UWZ37848.1 hypothetical protein Drose_06120 [Dactylosporangium roseum]
MVVTAWMIDDPGDGTVEYSALRVRQVLSALLAPGATNLGARSGVRPGGTGLRVTASGSTATIQTGACVVDAAVTTTQAAYLIASSATETRTIPPADGTFNRIDSVYARVYDHAVDASGQRKADIEYLAGTPSSTPAAPTLPPRSLLLGDLLVPTTGPVAVTDRRRWTVASGGILPVRDQAERDAVDAYDGLAVWRQDRKSLEVSDGSGYLEFRPAKIAENILGAAAASVTFSSISTTYRQLQLWVAARGDAPLAFVETILRINGDTTASYDSQQITGKSAIVAAFENIAGSGLLVGETAGASTPAGSGSVHVINIPWYRGTLLHKMVTVSHGLILGTASGSFESKHWSGRWRNTAAVNSLTLLTGSGNFVAGSSFALYGLP